MDALFNALDNLKLKKVTWTTLGLTIVIGVLTCLCIFKEQDISIFLILLSLIGALYLIVFTGKAVNSNRNAVFGGVALGIAIDQYVKLKVISTLSDYAQWLGTGIYTSPEVMEEVSKQYSVLSYIVLAIFNISLVLLFFNCKKQLKTATGIFVVVNIITTLFTGGALSLFVLFIAVLCSKSDKVKSIENNTAEPEKVPSQFTSPNDPVTDSCIKSAVNQVPRDGACEVASKEHKALANDNTHTTVYILLGIIAVLCIAIILILAKGNNNKSGNDLYEKTDSTENTYYSPEEDDEVYSEIIEESDFDESDDHSEQYIKSWIEDTYGTYGFLSSRFQDALSARDNAQDQGYLCGPEWDYWWWSQDPSGELELLGVDDITSESCTAYVVADGNRMYVKLTYYNGSWHYDNFIGADDNCNYYNLILEDL